MSLVRPYVAIKHYNRKPYMGHPVTVYKQTHKPKTLGDCIKIIHIQTSTKYQDTRGSFNEPYKQLSVVHNLYMSADTISHNV